MNKLINKIQEQKTNCLIVITIIGIVFAILATPIAGIYLSYNWAMNDITFKIALWESVKIWLSLFIIGVLIAFPAWVVLERNGGC